jgi:hypothetical protein
MGSKKPASALSSQSADLYTFISTQASRPAFELEK